MINEAIKKNIKIELNGFLSFNKIYEEFNNEYIDHLILKNFLIDSLHFLKMVKNPTKVENLEIINFKNLKRFRRIKFFYKFEEFNN